MCQPLYKDSSSRARQFRNTLLRRILGLGTPLRKRWRCEDALALNDDVGPTLGLCDRVVKQASLVLDIAPHLIGPYDDDAFELSIFGLLNVTDVSHPPRGAV